MVKDKDSFLEFVKKHPRLAKFIWGIICPKCNKTLMTEWYADYYKCPNCNHKVMRG